MRTVSETPSAAIDTGQAGKECGAHVTELQPDRTGHLGMQQAVAFDHHCRCLSRASPPTGLPNMAAAA